MNVRKNFPSGDQISMNDTWAESLDPRSNSERVSGSTGAVWNPWQPGLMSGVFDYDDRHLFNRLGVYNLPIFRGRQNAGSAPGWVNAMTGGWHANHMTSTAKLDVSPATLDIRAGGTSFRLRAQLE